MQCIGGLWKETRTDQEDKMSRMRSLVGWVAIVAVVLVACAPAPGAVEEGEAGQTEEGGQPCTVKIALEAPLTGDTAFWGNQMVQGATIALEQYNEAGGVQSGPYAGCLYEFVGPFDDQGDPAEATNIAQGMAGNEEILAMIGPVNSSNAFAILPILNEARIPTISGGASNPDLTKQGWDNFFRAFMHDGAQAVYLARYSQMQGWQEMVTAYSNTDYGRGVYESLAAELERLGIEILSADTWAPGEDRDFSALVTRWAEQAPDAIAIVGEYTEAALITKQARLAGMDQPVINHGGFNEDFLEIAGEQGEGVVVVTMFDPFRDDDVTQTFVQQFEEAFDEPAAENAAMAYAAFQVLHNAINNMQAEGREALLKEMAATEDVETLLGPVTFDETGEMVVPEVAPMVIVRDGAFESYTP
jgi:branched-chain amino acid transport system substrate-binding protein